MRRTCHGHEDSVSLTAHNACHANPGASRSNENTITNQPDEESQDFHALISERAYALYEEHGREDGHALED